MGKLSQDGVPADDLSTWSNISLGWAKRGSYGSVQALVELSPLEPLPSAISGWRMSQRLLSPPASTPFTLCLHSAPIASSSGSLFHWVWHTAPGFHPLFPLSPSPWPHPPQLPCLHPKLQPFASSRHSLRPVHGEFTRTTPSVSHLTPHPGSKTLPVGAPPHSEPAQAAS